MQRKSFLKILLASAAGLPLAKTLAGASAANPPPPPPDPSPLAPALPPGAWTLVVLPDSQSCSIGFPEVYCRQTEWIVANQGRYNIRFVAHEGDIVNNNSHPEWLNARRAMDNLLHAKIPFSLLPGNHDLGRWGHSETRDTFLNDYFTYWDYKTSEAVGYFETGRMENSWHRLTAPTGNFLLVSLEIAPRQAVLDWANRVVAEHADRDVIVVTHSYLYQDNTRYDWPKRGKSQHYNPKTYGFAAGGDANDGEEMWAKFVSRHGNIRFVLCGHVIDQGHGYLVSTGAAGNRVHQILANYQTGVVPDRGFGGAGYMRLMHFMADGKTVQVRTYSPWYGKFLTEPGQQFDLTV